MTTSLTLVILALSGCDVVMSLLNTAPVVILAKTTIDGMVGVEVDVDASGSIDPDGDTMSYSWNIELKPTGSALVNTGIINRTGSIARFIPDVAGTYRLTVSVSDAYATSNGSVTVEVAAADGGESVGSPTELAVTDATESSLTISWDAVAGVDGYELWRGTTTGIYGSSPVYDGTETSFLDTGLDAETTYFYAVLAYLGAEVSELSTEESGATLASGPIVSSTLTYDGNGNTGGTAPAAVDLGPGATSAVASAGTLTRLGRTFGGWNTASDGSGTSYAPGATFTMGSEEVSLFAVWNDLPPLAFSPGEFTIRDVIIDSVTPDGSAQPSLIEVQITMVGFDFGGETVAIAGANLYDSTGVEHDMENSVPEFVAVDDGEGNLVWTGWYAPVEGIGNGTGRTFLEGSEDAMFTFVRAGTWDRLLLSEEDVDDGIPESGNYFLGNLYPDVQPGDRVEIVFSQFVGTFSVDDYITEGYPIRNQFIVNYPDGISLSQLEISFDSGTTYNYIVQVSSTTPSGPAIDDVATQTTIEDSRNEGLFSVGTVSQSRVDLVSVVATPGGGLVFDVEINGDPISDNDFSTVITVTRLGTTSYPLP